MTYRILVVAEGKHFGLSTACLYINLAGELAETGVAEFPRGEYQVDITVGEGGEQRIVIYYPIGNITL